MNQRAKETGNKEIELITSVQYFKLTLPRMRELGVPITPENYAVWYEYTRGQTLELNKSIDELLTNNAVFSEYVNKDLYDTYIKERPVSSALEGVQSSTENLLFRLLNDIEAMQNGTERFSSVLEEGTKSLETDVSMEVLALLVTKLTTELKEVKKSNTGMETSLKAMTDEVAGLRAEMEELHGVAMQDALTGILNRRAFNEAILDLAADSAGTGKDFSLLVIDIDHFKKFNDTYGHISGDRVLVYVATLLKKGVKGTDYVARFGGEEFTILLPNTSYSGAMVVANNLCDEIASKTLVVGAVEKKSLGKITVSVGVSQYSPDDDLDSLVERADKALYVAKNSGRNRVMGEKDLKLTVL